tara:strand:+ start:5068 stop:5448 length:381 start_codon:yes stop_codon:yes gene_type:complete
MTKSRQSKLAKPVVFIKSISCSIKSAHHNLTWKNIYVSEFVSWARRLMVRYATATAAAFAILAISSFCSEVGAINGGSILLATYFVISIDPINTNNNKIAVLIPIIVRKAPWVRIEESMRVTPYIC